MATPSHTPEGRGYDSSLIYYEHKIDYYDDTLMQSSCQTYNPIVDLWDSGAPARALNGTAYADYLFRDRVLETIAAHDMASGPLFIHWTPHIAHCPLQVPAEWLAKYTFPNDESKCQTYTPYVFPGSTAADYRCRNIYDAMVSLLDEIVGNVTDAIKARGWWDETIMTLHADNGGPIEIEESGANNFPLRGGKYSDLEGGVRSAAFVSGGYLPPAVRGTISNEIIHVADWHSTYCGLAGGSPAFCATDAAAAANSPPLPPLDSLDVWPALSTGAPSPRTEIPLDFGALLQGDYKLLTGTTKFVPSIWQGPVYPNASTADADPGLDCSAGCLFDVNLDPTEHNDIAAAHPAIVAKMTARIQALEADFYTNDETGTDVAACAQKPAGMPCACYLALPGNRWNGFFGPYQE